MTSHWIPHTLRARLTTCQMAVIVIVLSVYIAVVLLLVTRNLSATLDARLRSDFRWAAEMAQQTPDGALSWYEGAPWRTDSPWLQVWTPHGELVYRTAVANRLPVPGSKALALQANGNIRSILANPAPFRILTESAIIVGQPLVIQVGRSEATMRLEVRELAMLLLLGLPLAVLVAGAGGYLLAREALAPLQKMTNRAQAVTATRLDERLPIENPHDELGQLALVFNDTLGRLESSFEQMRRFTANVSHELRTPLTAIRSVGEVGLREHHDATSYQHVIESMLEEADRLTRLVDRLLLVSRTDSGELRLTLETIHLGKLADEVAALLSVLAEEKHQIMLIEHVSSPKCQGDQVTLRQAVINLVDNAIRYTPSGGTIRVRISESTAHAMLEVCDTGSGIPENDRLRVFDRLYRGAHGVDATGSGLGLSIARWAVEANHGKLTYECLHGQGSVFRINLPLESSPTSSVTA